MEQSSWSRTEASIKRISGWSDLSPAQAGLAAALRRAFDLPADGTERQFAEMLSSVR